MLSFYLTTLAMLTPVLACASVGFFWARRGLPFSSQFLALLVTGISTPALAFHTLYTSRISNQELLDLLLISSVILFTCMGFAAAILRLLRMPVRMFLQTATFPNAGNFGLPMAALLFGEAGLTIAVAFFTVAAFIQHTVGVQTLPRGPGGINWKSPVMFAAVAAIAARYLALDLPLPIISAAQLIGSLTVPLMLISLGYALSSIPLSGLWTGSVIAAIRLVVGPAAGWLVTTLFGVTGTLQTVLILQAMMPCAVVSYIYASRFTNRAEVSAGAVLVSTAIFMLMTPIIAWLLDAPMK